MTRQLQYGSTAKILHWLVVVLLVFQYSIGWIMPDIKHGMDPGVGMTLHISLGVTILVIVSPDWLGAWRTQLLRKAHCRLGFG